MQKSNNTNAMFIKNCFSSLVDEKKSYFFSVGEYPSNARITYENKIKKKSTKFQL
jgi:hypothetical protein